MSMRGLLAGAQSSRVTALIDADARIRRPLALARRITLVHVGDADPAQPVTRALAHTLASRRHAPVLMVMADRPYGEPTGPVRPEQPQRLSDVTDGLESPFPDGYVLPLPCADGAVSVESWWDTIGQVGRFPDVLLSDLGRRSPGDALHAARRSHATCVLATADRAQVEAASTLARDCTRAGGRAVVCIEPGSQRAPRSAIGRLCRDLVPAPVICESLSQPTRSAPPSRWPETAQFRILQLAAALMDDGPSHPRSHA